MNDLDLLLEELSLSLDDDMMLCLEDCYRLEKCLEGFNEDEVKQLMVQHKALYKKYGFNPNASMSTQEENMYQIHELRRKFEKMKLEKLKTARLKSIKLLDSAMAKYDKNKDESTLVSFFKSFITIFGAAFPPTMIPVLIGIEKSTKLDAILPAGMLENKFKYSMIIVKIMNKVIQEKEKKPVKESYYGHGSTFDRVYDLI